MNVFDSEKKKAKTCIFKLQKKSTEAYLFSLSTLMKLP